MMDIKKALLQWFTRFLIKKRLICVQISLLVVLLKMRIFQTKNWPINYTNQLLETLRKENYNQKCIVC